MAALPKCCRLQWTGNRAHVALEEMLLDKLLVLLYMAYPMRPNARRMLVIASTTHVS